MSLWDAFRTKPEHIAQPVAEPPKPSFTPAFRDDVAIWYQGRVFAYIEPLYCATSATADKLCEVLTDLDVCVEMHPPLPFSAESPTQFTEHVPWLVLPDGRSVNAGSIANFFVAEHGYSFETSVNLAKEHVGKAEVKWTR